MQSIFKNVSIFIPSVELNKEIKGGKHIPPFDPAFPLILKLLRFKDDHILTPNYHDYLEIGYIVDGNGILSVENKKYNLKSNDIITLSSFETHTFSTVKNQIMDFIVIYFLPELVFHPASISVDFDYLKPFYYRGSTFSNLIRSEKVNSENLFNLFKNIYKLIIEEPYNYKLSIKNYLLDMLLIISNYYSKYFENRKPKTYAKRIKDLERLKELISFLQKEYRREITLQEAADSVNMSVHYFCKFFKKVIGKTYTNYLLSIRIDKAKELLLTEKTSTTSIAYKVGFENLSYFYRKFKEFTGFCPSEYIETIKNR